MADRPAARDEDRLPWLEPVGESEKKRARKPASRTVLVGLLVAFFGIGLALAFSLGYRFARPAADAPALTKAEPAVRQPERTASVNVPLSPPTPEPLVEPVAPQPIAEPPVAEPKPVVKAKPAIKKARAVRHKAKAPRRHAKRQPILRPFVNIKKRAPMPQPQYRSPYAGPRGRMVQVGAYSSHRQAESAWRSLVWRYPYLSKKPRVVAPTKPVGGWTYYLLRLGTETQAQSLVICQYLQARGQSCLVIY